VAAEVHCSQSGIRIAGKSAENPAVSTRAPSGPLNLEQISEDNDFTVITSKREQRKNKLERTITEAAFNIAFHPLPLMRAKLLVAQNTTRTNS
jgi:hypothetical protein